MQLPNKLYSYNNSVLHLHPIVLKEIKEHPVLVTELYKKVKPSLNDVTDFLEVMDCLYAINAIDLNEKNEIYICL